MSKEPELGKASRFNMKNVSILALILLAVIISGWALVTVSRAFQIPPSDFVTMPITPLSRSGSVTKLNSVTPIIQNGVTVGVSGYLQTVSGQAVSGAQVYAHYYLEATYRTQVTTTDANGYFEIHFPMNWTGWLPLTLTYFGDSQHEGLQQVFSLPGENL
ncbi:MAG TPA: hypothetical protein VLV31_10715 [Candidatus Acidoferrales bacterium]|nr:hypothetical protein [Candidatus Acidoferrales bacterium]